MKPEEYAAKIIMECWDDRPPMGVTGPCLAIANAIRAAVLDERESCAVVCDLLTGKGSLDCAKAIRAKKDK